MILLPKRDIHLDTFDSNENTLRHIVITQGGSFFAITLDSINVHVYRLGAPVDNVENRVITVSYEQINDYKQDWRGTTGADFEHMLRWMWLDFDGFVNQIKTARNDPSESTLILRVTGVHPTLDAANEKIESMVISFVHESQVHPTTENNKQYVGTSFNLCTTDSQDFKKYEKNKSYAVNIVRNKK